MINQIKQLLTDQGLMLNLVEMGCGCPVSEDFMKDDGASNYIYGSYSPYHKQAQYEFVGHSLDYRSVSGEFVEAVSKKLTNETAIINIVISMQVGKSKDNHGWICIDGNHFYHFTFGYGIGRGIARERIKGLVYDIIYTHYGDALATRKPIYGKYVDGYFKVLDRFGLDKFEPDGMFDNHAPFAIIDGVWTRLTEAFRNAKDINIVKGSFNPFHDAHKELLGHIGNKRFLSITTKSTVEGKNSIGLKEAITRIKRAGYNGIIDSSCTYYQELVSMLSEFVDLRDIKLHFSMGVDTFARYVPIDGTFTHVFARNIEVDNITFHESKYPDLSSTKLRTNENNRTST